MSGKPLPLTSRYVEDAATGCWNWTGHVGKYGYASNVQRMKSGVLREVIAHRFFYEEMVGPIAGGHDLDHLCRNRRCVNPAHLEPVTRAENIRRSRVAKLSKQDVQALRAGAFSGLNQAEIARHFNVNQSSISRVMTGRRWSKQ